MISGQPLTTSSNSCSLPFVEGQLHNNASLAESLCCRRDSVTQGIRSRQWSLWPWVTVSSLTQTRPDSRSGASLQGNAQPFVSRQAAPSDGAFGKSWNAFCHSFDFSCLSLCKSTEARPHNVWMKRTGTEHAGADGWPGSSVRGQHTKRLLPPRGILVPG